MSLLLPPGHGRFTISPVVSVKASGNASPATIYPNPTKDNIVFSVWSNRLENINWRIVDSQGRVMRYGHRVFPLATTDL